MIDIDALKRAGVTNKRLREIFESKAPEATTKKKVPIQPKPDKAPLSDVTSTIFTLEKLPDNPSDWDRRCYLETMIRGESLEGLMRCAQKFDILSALDLAYASIPIHPLVPDLMKLAMGHVTIDQCEASIGALSEESRKSLFERDAKGKPTSVNAPSLIQVSHNLVHSLTTRRVAALATEVYQTFPVLKYDPFSNAETGRCVAAVMTQLAEQMAGAFAYRHDYEESIRQASLYTTSIKFKKSAWKVDKQTLPIPPARNGAKKAGKTEKPTYERRIVREGVEFTTPHPSRVYYDISEPLSKLNVDLGPKWIGHWDVVPIGSVRENPAYFNREAIVMDAEMFSLFAGNPAYFSQYYDRISFPGQNCVGTANTMVLKNDRVAQIGRWAQLHRDVSTVLSQHYKQIIPKSIGLGTYEDPVWFRFVMAGNTTVVYSEIVGSCPASVNSYNAADGLLMNPSFGMQAIQWQQMLTNDLNRLLYAQYQGMVEIYALNKDGMTKADIEKIVNQLKNPNFTHIANAVITYSKEKLAQIGSGNANGSERLSKVVVDTSAKITEIFSSMVQTLALAERLMFFSPQELGQVSPRTVTATEMKAVRDTTLGIRDFHLMGVKQQIDADKRIVHASYMAFGSDALEVPVAERFDPKVIEAAGFEIVDDGTGKPPDGLYTIKGKKLGLFYNYTYTTRNTDDTPPDATVAQGIAQVYEILTKDPVLSQNTSLEQRMELANSLFAILDPNVFKLRVPPGVDGSKTQGDAVAQMQEQLKSILPQIGQGIQSLQKKQAEQDAKIAENDAGLKALTASIDKVLSQLEKMVPAPNLKKASAGPLLPNGTENSPGNPIAGGLPTLPTPMRATPVPILGG